MLWTALGVIVDGVSDAPFEHAKPAHPTAPEGEVFAEEPAAAPAPAA